MAVIKHFQSNQKKIFSSQSEEEVISQNFVITSLIINDSRNKFFLIKFYELNSGLMDEIFKMNFLRVFT